MMTNYEVKPSVEAQLVLGRLKIEKVPIDPWLVAQCLGIEVKEVDVADRYSGMLIKHQNNKAIVINSRISYLPRKKFTLAHEIGHASISQHTDSEYVCSESDIRFSLVKKQQEREANEFASELLMPSLFIMDKTKKKNIGFDVIKEIAQECETSLISSAFQYIKYCKENAMILVAEDSKVRYFWLSSEMWESISKRRLFTITPGTNLIKGSIAYYLFDTKFKEREDYRLVNLTSWFPELDYGKYKCFEHTIGFQNINKTISLVWLQELYDDNDDE